MQRDESVLGSCLPHRHHAVCWKHRLFEMEVSDYQLKGTFILICEENQREQANCSRSHSKLVVKLALKL